MLALMSWCQPALAQDGRYPISDVYVESNFASIPALGEKCTQPTMKLLYGYDETLTFDNGHWEKQDGTEWDMLNTSDVFEAGNTYRYTVLLKVVAAETAYNYLVSPAGGLSVSVNNVEWTPSNYSYSEGETSVTIHSPEFVWAEPANVNYFDPTAAAGAQTKKASAILLNSSNTLLSSGWYYVDGETKISDRITVMGTVNLILADGC